VDISDNSGNLSWWWNQLNVSEDWNNLTAHERNLLTKKFIQAFAALSKFNIRKSEIVSLITLTDISTVWEGLLVMIDFPMQNKSNQTKKPVWQKVPEETRKEKPASWSIVDRWDPLKKKFLCKNCGNILRRDNSTGLCRVCQRKGCGVKVEH